MAEYGLEKETSVIEYLGYWSTPAYPFSRTVTQMDGTINHGFQYF